MKCSSRDNDNCLTADDNVMSEKCTPLVLGYENHCFTHVSESYVQRGCLFEAQEDIQIHCYNFNEKSCQLCNESNCNHEKINVGANDINDSSKKQSNSAMYQTCSTLICKDDVIEPEFCISCDGQDPDCRNNTSSDMRKQCKLSHERMGCFHYEENDEIKRGCMSEIEDEDFRKLCTSNSDNCKTCMENECNSRQNGFQKCLTTDHSNSQSHGTKAIESKICTNYMDQCYTHVANNIVRRGCLRDVTVHNFDGIDVQSDCEDRDICEKCSGTNDCNNQKISIEFCTVCNSTSHPHCKGAPNHFMREQCPLSIKRFGCYLYQNSTDFVSRGCMSRDIEMRKLCVTEGDTCKYCFGDQCNKKIDFERCRYCSSDKDGENCMTKAWKMELKTCKYYMDECFTHVNGDGVVTRGCLSEFISDYQDTCERCSNEIGCNTIPIKRESCLACDSSNDSSCRSNVTPKHSEVCPLKTIRPLGCYHFINGTSTKRGCVINLSASDRRIAPEQPNQWKYCMGTDNCNSETAFISCLACDSTVDLDCISRPTISSSSIKLCNNYENSCFSYIGPRNVVRGCLNDLDWKYVTKCQGSPEKCDICSGENGLICNNKRYSEAKCISCNSDKDKRCRNQPELLNQKLCGLVDAPDEDLGCYLIHDSNNKVIRGCVSDLTVQQREICRGNSNRCKICKGNNCNSKIDFQYCYTCTSKDNPDCVNSDPIDTVTICPNYMDQCLTALDTEGYTVRKCFSNTTTEIAILQLIPAHSVCEESKCNGEIYPENRLHCFQCNGNETCDHLKTEENESLEELPCRMYSKYDKCFMFMDEGESCADFVQIFTAICNFCFY